MLEHEKDSKSMSEIAKEIMQCGRALCPNMDVRFISTQEVAEHTHGCTLMVKFILENAMEHQDDALEQMCNIAEVCLRFSDRMRIIIGVTKTSDIIFYVFSKRERESAPHDSVFCSKSHVGNRGDQNAYHQGI